ncbi:MAG: hypothetical protein AAGB19_13735 [Cyanobacteria bacterium P01_F01_bin.3]
MTEQLDRIESILEATATQQAKNTESIEALVISTSANNVAIRELGVKVDATTANVERVAAKVDATVASVDRLVRTTEETEHLFATVRAEAQGDRAETRRLWNDAISQMQEDRAEAKAEREENAKRFDAQLAENRKNFEAQQEVIQRLLIELVEMNRDNRRLRDRVDRLEAS